VDIGVADYFPHTPAAHEEWKLKPAFLEMEDITPGMLFMHKICLQTMEVVHVGEGLGVLRIEHDLLRRLMREYMMDRSEIIRGGDKHLKAAISYQIPIRMFWPGDTHKIYTDPKNEAKGQEKPSFHVRRVKLAAQYTKLLWKLEKEDLRKHKLIPESNNNLEIEWEEEIKKGFGKLKSLASQQHAIDLGFGYTWWKKKYSKESNTKFFENCGSPQAN
jgi:hypothetical protein